ncbi:PREDICTED: la-related protein 6A isoform X2 [Lupinus angustifolius]|uniref:la-related protein 6A isoform X2 n=1 Tax=Lupinus angustifolius TaxID=3871 RepID=UPI00092ED022|nr:PREDICTED: la-related protein 6A isoform X2 [Lupinus angustifolius]
MEGGELVLSSAAASPPPAEITDPSEFHSLISDEEHHHDLDHDHEEHDHEHDLDEEQQVHDHVVDNDVSLDDLKIKILKQVEYYFSDENLPTDKYLLGYVKRNKEGFVPISVIASFRKMKKLTRDYSFIVAALKESSLLAVSGDCKRVKRLNPQIQFRDNKLYTVLVENLPEDHSKENIHRIFNEAGNIKRITIHDPRPTAEAAKHIKQEKFISNKLHALVEYETIEAAEKAVAMLNDEQDWRNGMHVKPLKRMGHSKQTWKASTAAEKNSSSHVSEHKGDEGNHSSNEHHEDTHDEEDGEHLPKDTGRQGYRNQGRSRKHKYRAINGMGHGSNPSTHAAEASKPPPGPRMPDGTRGFAVGRGRPPVPPPN